MSPDGGKSPQDQIPQVYYSRKPSRRDGGEQDVTSSSIDWLRLKIGGSGRINTLGAWTESWKQKEREACDYCREGEGGRGLILLSFIVFVCRRVQNYVKWGLNPQVQMY